MIFLSKKKFHGVLLSVIGSMRTVPNLYPKFVTIYPNLYVSQICKWHFSERVRAKTIHQGRGEDVTFFSKAKKVSSKNYP